MILPLITPQNLEVLNLANVVRVRQVSIGNPDREDEISLRLADGTDRTYKGEAAGVVNAELIFALNAYRSWQQSVVKVPAQPSIIVPNGLIPHAEH